MKVVFHIDEMDKWALLSQNITNLAEKDPNVTISVVVNADAVNYFQNNEAIDLNPKAKYHLCNNSLKQRGIDQTIVNDRVVVVKTGVYEIALLQSLGYHYIKP
ncbi:MAG TPA: hypothetical protein VJY66_01370 [Acholeplasma sp.]|nr:hypothetical protein [Acholeplasma sp.]